MNGGALHRVRAVAEGQDVISEAYFAAHETATVVENLGDFVRRAQEAAVTTFALHIEPIGYTTLKAKE